MKWTKTAIIAAMTTLFGCASQPSEIPAQSVSELQYQSYNCNQIGLEAERISNRTSELYAALKKKADNDAAQMGIGLILFWPTLFLLEGGDGPEAQEYGRLKGEYAAVEKVAVKKECGTIARMKTPEEYAAEAKANSHQESDNSLDI